MVTNTNAEIGKSVGPKSRKSAIAALRYLKVTMMVVRPLLWVNGPQMGRDQITQLKILSGCYYCLPYWRIDGWVASYFVDDWSGVQLARHKRSAAVRACVPAPAAAW